MQKPRKNIIRVGLFITVAFVLFIIAILLIGREQNLFRPNVRITTVFSNVKGLKVGNNVRFSGINVGTVINMNIYSDTVVVVDMSIDRSVTKFIKKNSMATIGNEGLMGNKLINILPGTPESPSIEQGDRLGSVEAIEIDDILLEIKKSSENISVVSSNLIDITDKINRGEGMFGKIFTDTTLTRNLDKTSYNAARISSNILDLSNRLNEGHGILGKMFADTLFSVELDSFTQSLGMISDNIIQITEKINKGEGIFGRLFTDTTLTNNLYTTSLYLKYVSENLMEVSYKLNTEDNVLNKFIADTTFTDSLEVMINRLNQGILEATEASEAIQRSGIIRMFSKKEKEEKTEKEGE